MTIYKPKVYTASKLHYHKLWKTLREDPEWDFVDFTASWVDIAHLEAEQPSPDLFREAWVNDIFDIHRSDFVLLYGRPGETLRGALIECGAAIGIGTNVLAVGIEDQTWLHHPLVKRFGSLREARDHLYKYITMAPPTRRKRGKSND